MPSHDIFDFVVVGTGTAGATLVNRLSADGRPRAHASRVLFEGKRAVGVEYLRGGERRVVRAAREVIVAGGAVNSPQLLQLSGLGSPALLGELGIPVRRALPGVGENLRGHYAIRTAFRVGGARTINELARGWRLGVEVVKIGEKAADMILGVSPPEPAALD